MEEEVYREELEFGPLFSDVERGTGFTQEQWDILVKENWEGSMLRKAQLLGIEDPPFAEAVKDRMRAEAMRKQAPVSQGASGTEESGAGTKFVCAVVAVLLVFGLGMFSCDSKEPAESESNALADVQEMRVAVRVWMRSNISDPDAELMGFDVDYEPPDDVGYAEVQIRGRNAFGGYVINRYEMEIDRATATVVWVKQR